ncbi:MAG: serine O-acetyltransferase [Clostridia bacterium]|nr:serine O-acetyltransferase [Clostridia bacterium]
MFYRVREDVKAVRARDPAAKSELEVLLCYPTIRALFWYRVAHRLYQNGRTTLARWISQRTARKTGIEIHPGARIGRGLFIDHGNGVVIGETTVIGDDVTIYQGVTLGGTGKDTGKRHPTVGDGVTIGAGAKVLGPFAVGNHSKVGAGAVVLKEVPPYCTVVGNPGRIVRKAQPGAGGADLDQINLPDPVKKRLDEVNARLDQIDRCIELRFADAQCEECEDKDTHYCPKTYKEDEADADF